METNPHKERLIQSSRVPSPAANLIAFAGTLAVCTGLVVAVYEGLAPLSPYGSPLLEGMGSLALLYVSLLGLGVLVSAVMTAITTSRDAESESFQLLRTTGLSPKQIVSGYLGAAFYRLRLLWAVLLALAAETTLALAIFVHTREFYFMCDMMVPCAAPGFAEALASGLILSLLPAGAILLAWMRTLYWMGLALAIWLSLWRRNKREAVAGTLTGVLCIFAAIGAAFAWGFATEMPAVTLSALTCIWLGMLVTAPYLLKLARAAV
jgi:hypothetical protein